jgi:hypothetical protein
MDNKEGRNSPDDAELLEEDRKSYVPDVKEPFAALAFKIATDHL